jgi:cytochrome c oxidase subunit IV
MSEQTSNHTGGHIVPVKNYVVVFLCLLILTALTTKVAYMDLGQTAVGATHEIDWNTVAALAIAVVKMLLVVLFFMHVKYSPGLTKLVIAAGGLWLAIMIALTLSDELSRHWTDTALPWNVLLPFLHLFR